MFCIHRNPWPVGSQTESKPISLTDPFTWLSNPNKKRSLHIIISCPKVVEVLQKLGLLAATKRERIFMEGAHTASPTKQKRQRTTSSPNRIHKNRLIAQALRDEARDIDGSHGIALNSAARNVGNHPKELIDVRTCMEVNGVGTQLAEKIITEILKKELTEDGHLHLAVVRVKQRQPRACSSEETFHPSVALSACIAKASCYKNKAL